MGLSSEQEECCMVRREVLTQNAFNCRSAADDGRWSEAQLSQFIPWAVTHTYTHVTTSHCNHLIPSKHGPVLEDWSHTKQLTFRFKFHHKANLAYLPAYFTCSAILPVLKLFPHLNFHYSSNSVSLFLIGDPLQFQTFFLTTGNVAQDNRL